MGGVGQDRVDGGPEELVKPLLLGAIAACYAKRTAKGCEWQGKRNELR